VPASVDRQSERTEDEPHQRPGIAGGADVAEIVYTPFADRTDARPVRLIVRRVRPTPGSQLALFTRYDYG